MITCAVVVLSAIAALQPSVTPFTNEVECQSAYDMAISSDLNAEIVKRMEGIPTELNLAVNRSVAILQAHADELMTISQQLCEFKGGCQIDQNPLFSPAGGESTP